MYSLVCMHAVAYLLSRAREYMLTRATMVYMHVCVCVCVCVWGQNVRMPLFLSPCVLSSVMRGSCLFFFVRGCFGSTGVLCFLSRARAT